MCRLPQHRKQQCWHRQQRHWQEACSRTAVAPCPPRNSQRRLRKQRALPRVLLATATRAALASQMALSLLEPAGMAAPASQQQHRTPAAANCQGQPLAPVLGLTSTPAAALPALQHSSLRLPATLLAARQERRHRRWWQQGPLPHPTLRQHNRRHLAPTPVLAAATLLAQVAAQHLSPSLPQPARRAALTSRGLCQLRRPRPTAQPHHRRGRPLQLLPAPGWSCL